MEQSARGCRRACREFIKVSRQREEIPRGFAALWIICVQSLLGGAVGVTDPGGASDAYVDVSPLMIFAGWTPPRRRFVPQLDWCRGLLAGSKTAMLEKGLLRLSKETRDEDLQETQSRLGGSSSLSFACRERRLDCRISRGR